MTPEDKLVINTLIQDLDAIRDKISSDNETIEPNVRVCQTTTQRSLRLRSRMRTQEVNHTIGEEVTGDDSDVKDKKIVDTNSKSRQQSDRKSDSVREYKGCNKSAKRKRKPKPRPKLVGKTVKCDYKDCEYKCRTEVNLKSHMKSHFNAKTEPFREQRRHIYKTCYDLSTNSYVCHEIDCQKSYRTYRSFRLHLLGVHTDKTFACDYDGCEKRFTTLYRMRQHYKIIHNTAKALKCHFPGCRYIFRTKPELEKHFARHYSEKAFSCDIKGCGKAFTTALALRVHLRLHNSEPTYKLQCDWPGCDFLTKGTNALNAHKRVHTGEKPYWPGCQYSCNNSSNIRKHHKQVHKVK
ncbi:unnamed protein product [Oppiella nova]|uniref:C2H2-type domain-containing protein n=1 Tax=Oppiella nova TaxID=334625 RepID=A0A7R9M2X1_9ACAR|nr:unnamed protein product [Oppiella nova]CAG2169561.1 unnamed protein product [Oppiella nova]